MSKKELLRYRISILFRYTLVFPVLTMLFYAAGLSNDYIYADIAGKSTSTTWYLAEGSTSGFETWLLIYNPDTSTASVTITYSDQDGNTAQETTSILSNCRHSRKVNDVSGMNDKGGVSVKVESSVGVVVERSMYWYDPGNTFFVGGNSSIGATSASTAWYLAEGSTAGFDMWLLIHNPDTSTATVTITYSDQDGNTTQKTTTISSNCRYSKKVNDVSGMDDKGGVSVKVESSVGVVVERSMYWYDSDNTFWVGGHSSKGAASASTTWYLAEGSTSGFETWLMIHNPDTSTASVTITYSDQDGNTAQETTSILSNCRHSRKVNDVSGMDNKSGVSVKVESSVGVVVARSMYWYDPIGLYWLGGHSSIGAASADTTWYLAEGCTDGYETWLSIHNPDTSTADVTITYSDEDGNTAQETTSILSNCRYTKKVNDVSGMDDKGGVSAKVESSVGVVVERSMYWYNPDNTNWVGGHSSKGAASASTTWYLAEGSTSGFDMWLLIHNPDTSTASVTITYSDEDGNTAQETTSISSNCRYSRKVNDVSGMDDKGGVSAKVESSVGVVVERSMYWYDPGNTFMVGGNSSIGAASASTTWYLAEGCTNGFDMWLLIHNPDTSTASVTITYSDQDGNTAQETTSILSNCRHSRKVNDVSGMDDKSGVSVKVESSVGVVVERSMYWYDPDNTNWVGGHSSKGA